MHRWANLLAACHERGITKFSLFMCGYWIIESSTMAIKLRFMEINHRRFRLTIKFGRSNKISNIKWTLPNSAHKMDLSKNNINNKPTKVCIEAPCIDSHLSNKIKLQTPKL